MRTIRSFSIFFRDFYFDEAKVNTNFTTYKYRLYSILYFFLLKLEKAMLINELSKKTGVTIHTIRYYENLGLIKGTTDENVKTNNYKNYDESVVERLEIIMEAKEVGFTLAEIRKLLESWFENSNSKSETAKLFQTKIQEIENKIKQFRQIKKRLEKVVEELSKGEC